MLDTNWGTVRFGIVVFCVGLVTAIGAFLVAIDFHPSEQKSKQQESYRLQASPVLLQRTGN
jgi:hypothetical protein